MQQITLYVVSYILTAKTQLRTSYLNCMMTGYDEALPSYSTRHLAYVIVHLQCHLYVDFVTQNSPKDEKFT